MELFYLSLSQTLGGCCQPVLHSPIGLQVVVGQHRDEASFYFIVGEVQHEGVRLEVKVLDGEVAALVNHGERTIHIGLVVNKLLLHVVAARHLVYILAEVVEQTDEVGGRACAEPVVLDVEFLQ